MNTNTLPVSVDRIWKFKKGIFLPMKKIKTYTVTQLDKMMMRDDLSLWEIIDACSFIDICDCYEPLFYPPKEQEDEWRRMRGEYEPAYP